MKRREKKESGIESNNREQPGEPKDLELSCSMSL